MQSFSEQYHIQLVTSELTVLSEAWEHCYRLQNY